MMRAISIGLLLLLTACSSVPEWAGGSPAATKINRKDADKRLPVVAGDEMLVPDAETEDFVVDVPEQASNPSWLNSNDAMHTGHLGITGLAEKESATIGEGYEYEQGLVPTPVVDANVLYAMDGAGAISAHDAKKLDHVYWTDSSLVEEDEPAIIGGGVSLDNGVLYAVTGYGKLAAFDAVNGKRLWKISIGVPVRGAPQASKNVLVVVTVDNQTLAFDAESGRSLWSHRGIRETAGYLSAISPVVADDVVLAAYSSGEIVALRLESGTVLWSDTLINPERTRASDVLTGIDADPVVVDGMVYAVSTSGSMVANALLNGRTLWQQRIDGHNTPWLAGNVLYMLTAKHQLLGIARANGKVVWTQNLGTKDDTKDTTPPLFGPILAGNAVIVITGEGELMTFRPRDGKKLGRYDVPDDVSAPPVVVDGTLYLVTKSANVVALR